MSQVDNVVVVVIIIVVVVSKVSNMQRMTLLYKRMYVCTADLNKQSASTRPFLNTHTSPPDHTPLPLPHSEDSEIQYTPAVAPNAHTTLDSVQTSRLMWVRWR